MKVGSYIVQVDCAGKEIKNATVWMVAYFDGVQWKYYPLKDFDNFTVLEETAGFLSEKEL